MTKAQHTAFIVLFEYCSKNKGNFEWREIVDTLTNKKCRVKNWLKVRNILQFFINEDFIKRTNDLRVEQYKVTDKGADIKKDSELLTWYLDAKKVFQ